MVIDYRLKSVKDYEATTPPIIKLIFWAAENPERALDVGMTLIAIGLTLAFIGAVLTG